MPTERYEYKSEGLRQQFLQKEIDLSKYESLLAQIQSEEIRRYSPESQVSVEESLLRYERRQRDQTALDIQRMAEEERQRQLSVVERYREEIPHTLEKYREESNRYRNIHNTLQYIVIIGSLIATTATGATATEGFGAIARWIAVVASLAVGIAAGIIGYFKFRERSFNLQQTADAIEHEYVAVGLSIGYYKNMIDGDALVLFAERVEHLKQEQKKRQQQLEQPPDVKAS